MSEPHVLEMRGISKSYGGNAVLTDVSLSIRPGEIHALLGENGAGKSTLMNILFGMPVIHKNGGFEGQLLLEGQPVSILSPNDAMHLGIGMVHQEFMLIPGFTITENIKLNREIARPTLLSRVFGHSMERLDTQAMRADTRKALDSVGMGIDEYTLVAGLPVGHMQFVEIAREIDKQDMKLLVFDEPTAVLTESEAEQLIGVMRSIAQRGIAIIFITHRLDEVMAAADNITILRDGHLVATRAKHETNLVELAEMMIGRTGEAMVEKPARQTPVDAQQVAMRMRGLWVDMPGERAKGVDLTVQQGEILGIGGLAGQGKIGIPNGIMGIFPAEGEVELFGEPLQLNNARRTLMKRAAMVSEDRRGVGLLLDQSIEDNIAFSAMQVKGGFLRGMLPKTAFKVPKLALWLVAVASVVLLVLGQIGVAQNQKAFNTSIQIKAYIAHDKELSARLAAPRGELMLEEAAPAGDGDVSAPADVPAAEPIVSEPDPDAVFLSEKPRAALTGDERRTLFLAEHAMLFFGCGLGLGLLLLALWAMSTGSVTLRDGRKVRAFAQEMIEKLDIRCTGPSQTVGTLSGGNQQKVCIARALALQPSFLFVSEPTRGIDIGAKRLVLETLVSLNREQGLTVVMASSELLELRSICDRIAIVSDGVVSGVFASDAPNADIGLAMSGIHAKGGEADDQ